MNGKDGPALLADGIAVVGDMYCDGRFYAEGTVSLIGAKIAGALRFTYAYLDGRGGPALMADKITVDGDVYCDREFRARGEISLCSAHVSQLNFSRARLDGKDGRALNADQLSVTSAMYCTDGFQAAGLISLVGASFRQLSFQGARLVGVKNPDGTVVALDAQDLNVTSEMFCDSGPGGDGTLPEPFKAEDMVILAGAKIGRFVDDKESWLRYIQLDGLTYDDLAGPDLSVRERLRWLRRTPYRFSPQPYQQLAAFYQGLGDDKSAKRVLLESQRVRNQQRWAWARSWGWVQDGLTGYGYVPGRALTLLAVAFVAGWAVFRSHPPTPVDPAAHPVFNPVVYTLDVLIPGQVLGQASDWDPHGLALVVALVLRLFGWLLAITVAAAIARSFARS